MLERTTTTRTTTLDTPNSPAIVIYSILFGIMLADSGEKGHNNFLAKKTRTN